MKTLLFIVCPALVGCASDPAPPQDPSVFDPVLSGSIRQIATGCSVSYAVMADGSVYNWGTDLLGVLNASGSPDEQIRARRVEGLSEIVQISTTCDATCAVDRNHHIWCMGENRAASYRDRFLTGSEEDILHTPRMRRDINDALEVSWFSVTLMIRRGDGSMLITNRETERSHRFVSPVVGISGHYFDYCAVVEDGHVYCSAPGGARIVNGLDEVSAVSVGLSFDCALRRDGTVWCWGGNAQGETGTPPEMGEVCDGGNVRLSSGQIVRIYYSCVTTPTPVPGLRDVVEISAGDYTACARRRDGTVWCWGANDSIEMPSGQTLGTIGDGLPNTERCVSPPSIPPGYESEPAPCRRRPTRVVGITSATALSVGSGRACAVQNGQVWCWGARVGPTLRFDLATDSAVPVPVRLPPLRRDQ